MPLKPELHIRPNLFLRPPVTRRFHWGRPIPFFLWPWTCVWKFHQEILIFFICVFKFFLQVYSKNIFLKNNLFLSLYRILHYLSRHRKDWWKKDFTMFWFDHSWEGCGIFVCSRHRREWDLKSLFFFFFSFFLTIPCLVTYTAN